MIKVDESRKMAMVTNSNPVFLAMSMESQTKSRLRIGRDITTAKQLRKELDK